MPSKSALSRFIAVVLEVERDVAGLSQMQQRLTDELVERLPDFGADVGFDGKALRSHSTGRRTASHQTRTPPGDATPTSVPTTLDVNKRLLNAGSATRHTG